VENTFKHFPVPVQINQRTLLTGHVDYHNEHRCKAKPLNNFAFKKALNCREKHKPIPALFCCKLPVQTHVK